MRYYGDMSIQSFRCPDAHALFNRQRVARFVNIEAPARRKLEQLHMAGRLNDLRYPPATGWKNSPETGKANTASASMTSGACVSPGQTATLKMLKLSIITDGGRA